MWRSLTVLVLPPCRRWVYLPARLDSLVRYIAFVCRAVASCTDVDSCTHVYIMQK